ncbi:hypothetical protein LCGC14_0979740 [marine sediment metagenome]|uniref:Uncharacterized protein n=1 Tax=marine sediment metagenome TaxID=412755 RepID=A0A0F9RFL7_9ZZZZ
MFPLRQSPDEPVATAEPSVEEGAQVLIPEQEKPVPATEQEPGAPAPESGAGGPEDEGEKPEGEKPEGEKPEGEKPDLRSQTVEMLKEMRESHPDLMDEVFPTVERERLEEGEQASAELELRESRLNRQEARQATQAQFNQQWGAIFTNAAPTFQEFQNELQAQNERVRAGQAESVNISYDKLATAVEKVRSDTASTILAYSTASFQDAVQEALDTHPTRRYLTAEDRKRVEDAKPEERIQTLIHAQLDAALKRGAPAEAKAQAKKEAEDTLGLTEKLSQVRKYIDSNGTTQKVEAGGDTSSFASMSDADIAYANDEIDFAEYKKQRKRFNLPDVAR